MKVKRLRVQYRPYPVVGVISPWNFPLILSLGDAIPALQAGAAVVIKPSEITPLGLKQMIEAWKNEIGGPDVLDVVNGGGETGSALVDQVDFVQFTGSDRTAKKVLAQAAETPDPRERRARRQGPDDRAAVRRRREGRERRRLGRLPEHGSGLHVGRAALRRGARLRRVPAALHRRGEEPEAGDGRARVRLRPRRDDLHAADGDRRVPCRRRPRAGRHRAHRRRAHRGRRRLVPADRDHRRRPLDEGDGGRDRSAPWSG